MDNKNQQDPLRTIAYEIIEEKHGKGISEVMKEAIADELVATMERYVNNELLNKLNNEQAEEFVTFMEDEHTEQEVVDFISKYGVDMKAVVSVALANFRDNYLD